MGRRRAAAEESGAERRSALAAVASEFKRYRPANQVMHTVRAVPTRFVQFDHATRVGGFPIERFTLGHGPSNEGKTAWALGLVDSFLSRDHFAFYVDAERTTPIDWARKLLGGNADHPGFYAKRPDSYEDTIADVREFLNKVATLRAKGRVPKSTSVIIVVDSLRKLVPKDLMAEILKEEKRDRDEERSGKRKITAGRDRGAQLKAKMNAAWMDEVVPLLEHAQAGFFAIAREMVNPDAGPFQKKFGNNYTVGGGGAIYYDASLVVRIERATWVHNGKEGKEHRVYGERHRVTVKKTKIGEKSDRTAVCHFHTSNGQLIPFGFDRARDVLELAQRFDIVKQKGGWLMWDSKRWQGENAAVERLTADYRNPHPDFGSDLERLEAEVRREFAGKAPIEHNADGEVA